MAIFRLSKNAIRRFVEAPEIYANLQLGKISSDERACLVIDGLIAIVVDSHLTEELQEFWEQTWRKHNDPLEEENLKDAYKSWIDLQRETEVELIASSSNNLAAVIAGGAAVASPPAPPSRPNLVPSGPPIPWTPPGHLPFETTARTNEIFYRFEAWPSSNRLTTVAGQPTIAADTYASPESELVFIPTGFAAVARCALPSFVPAVFRYQLMPAAGSKIRCGAVVPMFGQSGGGVEVMFTSATLSQQPFTPTIIQPF